MPKITALPPLSAVSKDDVFAIVDDDDGTTKKVSLSAIQDLLTPVGIIDDYAGTTAPTGWLLCYGQTLDADTNPEYQDLYNAIGNTYGGADNTDFVVPDLRGRVVAGQDDMGGTSANRLTGISGSVDGDLLGGAGGRENTYHAFYQPPRNTNAFQDAGTNYVNSQNGDINTWLNSGNSSSLTETVNIRNVGGTVRTNGSTATEVRYARYTAPNTQPTLILNKIIKY